MSNVLRVESDVVARWREALSAHRAVRGVDPVLKHVLDALTKEGADGHVPLERHKVFSWAEELRGAAARADPTAAQALTRVADDMRSFMMGRIEAQSPPVSVPSPAPSPAPPPFPSPAPAFATAFAPPAVQYVRPGGASSGSGGAVRLLSERELGPEVARMIRDARTELLLVSPWAAGLDALAKDVLAVPPGVAVKVLTRRPPQDDPEYHRALAEMRKRAFDVVASPYLHTRMVVKDAGELLLGAAGNPGAQPGSRELAVLTADPAAAQAAREAFLRLQDEARGKA